MGTVRAHPFARCTLQRQRNRLSHVAAGAKTAVPTGATDLQAWAIENGAKAPKITVAMSQGA